MPLWCWGSPRDRLNSVVNHETEPVSAMLSRLTVLVWDMYFLVVGGTEKLLCCQASCQASSSYEKAGALNPASLPLFPICPSQWTEANDCLEEKMDGGSKRPRDKKKKKKRVSRTESERDVWQRTSPQTEWQMRGLWSRDIFPQWSKLGSLPARLRSQLLTLVDRVKIQGAGNILHFNVIFHSIDRNSLLTWLYC